MTGPDSETESPGTRPISVAELLARNGTIGAPAVTRRRRRRRGDHDAVTVAELTAEIPVVRDDGRDRTPPEANGTLAVAEPGPPAAPEAAQAAPASPETEDRPKTAYWSEPEPRWPTSPQPHHASGPERSAYPRPLPHPDAGQDELAAKAGAEGMSPDPVDHYADVEVMDSDVREAEPGTDDSAYARSDLADSDATLFGGQTLADEMARRRGASNAESPALAEADEEAGDEGAAEAQVDIEASPVDAGRRVVGVRDRLQALWRASVVVFQSVLAVVFGAGLFVAFDQLWRWNSIVALVLSVLVILGLVAGVRVVRKTEDIASTLIAVAVGALITLGPLALSLQSG